MLSFCRPKLEPKMIWFVFPSSTYISCHLEINCVNVCPQKVQKFQILNMYIKRSSLDTKCQKCYLYLRKVTIDVICLTYQEATLPSLHSLIIWPLLSIYWRILSPVSRKEEIGNWIASSLFGPPTIPATSFLYWLTQIYVMKWYFAGSTQFETS